MMVGPVSISPPRGASGLWDNLSRNQRLALGGVAALALAMIVTFASMARSPEYGVAFSNLPEAEAAALVAKLKEAKISYELAERGTIKVPANQVQETRLLAAAAGIAQKGPSVGMELFNQPQFGLTEFAEKVNYRRALEGELSRSVARIDAIDNARVHLVVPEPSLFTKDQKEPTASTVVQLKPGRKLDAGQVQGIVQLVSSSVEGLKPQNVTVLDDKGAVLTERGAETDPARQTGTRADVQRTLETRLGDEVRTMLAPVVGPDKAVVRVSAELNWDQAESVSETFSPNSAQPQIRSRREQSETSSQGTGPVGGVPGVERNVPTYAGGAAGGATQGQADRRDTTTNYELSKTVEKLTKAPGGIKRLNVAVALDSEAVADPAQADAISRLVATAAGLNTDRGDLVTLTSLPFSPAGQRPAEVAEAARQREFFLTLARLLAMVLGPLMVVGLVWLILRRGRPEPAKTTISTLAAAMDTALEDAAESGADAKALAQDLIGRLPVGVSQAPSAEETLLQHEVSAIAEADPAAVAALIRTWMNEEGAAA